MAQLVGSTGEGDGTTPHHQDPVGHFHGLVDVLFDQKDTHAVVGRRPHDPEQSFHDERGEAEGQLVHQQQAWTPREPSRQRQHLLLASRQQTDASAQVRLELGEQFDGASDVAPAHAQVLRCGQVHEDRAFLGDERKPLPSKDVQWGVAVTTEHVQLAAERSELARQRQERGRLAGTVGTEHRDDLARFDGEIEPSNDLDVAVARPEPAGLDERAHVVTSVRTAAGGSVATADEPR